MRVVTGAEDEICKRGIARAEIRIKCKEAGDHIYGCW